MTELKQIHNIVIAATAEKVWQALTTPEFTQQYWHNTRVQSDWQVGSDIVFLVAGDGDENVVGCEGKILKVDKPKELSYTWSFPQNSATQGEEPSRVTFYLVPIGEFTKLTVIHDQFPDASKMFDMVEEGWLMVIAGLKTLLETGQAVDFSSVN